MRNEKVSAFPSLRGQLDPETNGRTQLRNHDRSDNRKKANAKNAAPKGDANRATQFTQKDTDKDGQLSWEEFSKNREPADAKRWFTARDQDGNGTLSREEFITNNVPNSVKKP